MKPVALVLLTVFLLPFSARADWSCGGECLIERPSLPSVLPIRDNLAVSYIATLAKDYETALVMTAQECLMGHYAPRQYDSSAFHCVELNLNPHLTWICEDQCIFPSTHGAKNFRSVHLKVRGPTIHFAWKNLNNACENAATEAAQTSGIWTPYTLGHNSINQGCRIAIRLTP